ncbi:MAG: hypothetical protein E7637_04630 [Ruminococcaceae bacterium]|nr:hypothetical protein [Oscillospiraceae bacterium]
MKRAVGMLWISFVSLLLCAVMLATPVSSVAVAASESSPFDFGTDAAAKHETLDANTLIEILVDGEVSAAESDYLKRFSEITMRYSNFIPESNITTHYDRERHSLDVTVHPYSYTANNGATVRWIPTEVLLDGKVCALTLSADGGYACTVEEVLHTGIFEMEVRFEWNVTLPDDAVNLLLNAAYTAGSDALEEILAHELLVTDYEARVEAYRKYVQYLEDKTAYDVYCDAYAEYERQLEAYNVYLGELAVYKEQKALYDAWQRYFAYVDFQTNRLPDFNKYVAYQQQVDAVKAKLQPLESLFVWDSNGRQFYAALMGNLVTLVLKEENKADLIAAGCTKADVNAAGVAAVALRELMEPYAELRKAKYASSHEKYTALYAYYTEHHAALTKHFSDLCSALNSLCDCSVLIINLDKENKLEHYRKFVAQLYVTATALDDSVKRDPAWTVNKRVWSTVIQECNIVPDDILADPSTASMPADEVPPVEEVPEATRPEGEQLREEPTAPKTVEEPSEPEVVVNPDLAGIPPVAEKPEDTAPIAPVIDETLRTLALQIREGSFASRDPAEANRSFCLQTSVSRSVSVDNRKQIRFYASDRTTLLAEKWVEYGTAFSADGIEATRPSDAQYHYRFDGWRLSDGTAPSDVVESDMTLIAQFVPELRSYTVTWILNAATRTEEVFYGTVPTPPFSLTPTPSVGHQYVFSGWSPSVEPVTGDVTYQATLLLEPLLYTVTWNFGDRVETTTVAYGSVPEYTGDVSRAPDNARYEFEGWFDAWNDAPMGITGDVTYTARYKRIALATKTDQKTELTVSHTESAIVVECASVSDLYVREAARLARETGKSLTLQFEQLSMTVKAENLGIYLESACERIKLHSKQENNGLLLELQYLDQTNTSIPIELPVSLNLQMDSANVSVSDGENSKPIENGTVDVVGSVNLQVKPIHSVAVSVNGNQNCDVSKIPVRAEVGTLIDLRVSCDFGYEISGARVRTADGVEIAVDQLCFVMPNADVTVELQISRIVYTVVFRVDGQVISQSTYGLGEKIVLPATPTKPSDGQYDYTFKSWTPDPLTAIGEVRELYFDAIFEAFPVTHGNPYHSGRNNNFMLTVILPILAAVLVVGITAFVVRRKRKKKKANASASTDT